MDVKCEQCGAEYEFDESLLGEKGTTVKCAACNHVFRVLPRRQDDGRSSLKLRYVRTGRVETLSSLRELQQRIRNGEASVDDQIGRDGFPYRRLGDVPELRNFFTLRGSAASSSMRPGTPAPAPPSNHLPVSPTSMSPPNDPPRNPQGGRTVLGVGPQNQAQTPRPGAAPLNQPGMRGNGAGAPMGTPRAPTSDAPTATRPRPPDDPSVSQAPTLPGTAAEHLRAQAARGPSLPPGGLPAAGPRHSGPPPAHSNPVRLYLDENERAPARATEDSSKIWVYAAVLLLLGGAAFFTISMLSGKKSDTAEAASRVEVPTPAPTVTPTADAPIPAPGTPPVTAQGAPATGAPSAQPATQQPAAAQPTPEQLAVPEEPATAADKPSEGTADKGSADKGSKPRSGGSSDSGKEPTDYGGWVSKGDKAFSRGELEQARTAYQNALALRGTGSEANTGLGFTLLAEGRAKDAIPHFDRAAGSGYAEASIGLGDAYRRLGQKGEAAEAYKDYLQRLPSGSRAGYAKAQLAALGAGSDSAEKPQAPAGNGEYRPAGELEPAPAPAPSEPAPEGTP